MRRAAALLLPIVLLAAVLSGCVKNLPNGAVDWLAGQDGISDARILSDNTGAWSSSGLVRGELDEGIDDAGIQTLIGKIQKYAAENGNVSYWLGFHDIDFNVDSGDNASDIALWRQVLDVPGLATAIVSEGEVRAHAMRPDAIDALTALHDLDAGVRLEAFSDDADLTADYAADLQYDQVNVVALEYRRPKGCEPERAVLDFAESLVDRPEIPGATIDLCGGITLDLPVTASVATTAVEVRAELDERGLSEFPVQVTSATDDATRFAAIAPGDPSLLAVLAVFEQPGTPPMSYSLSPDETLAVTAFDVPTADLVTLMQGAPAASGLAGIGLEGDPVSILGTLAQLPALLAEATALDAASDTFGSVQLGQGFGGVTLESAVGSDPDVVAAVAALRASGVPDGRFFSVHYLNMQLDIANDVAALSDDGYTDPHVMQAFVDAWNAG